MPRERHRILKAAAENAPPEFSRLFYDAFDFDAPIPAFARPVYEAELKVFTNLAIVQI